MSYQKPVLHLLLPLILAFFLLPSCSGSNPAAPPNNEGGNDPDSSGYLFSAGLDMTQADNSTYDNLRPDDDLPPYAPDEVLVTLKPVVDSEVGGSISLQENSVSILDQHGLSLKDTIDCGWSEVFVLKITDRTSVPDKIAELQALPMVDMAEPNIRFDFCDVPYTPNDPLWENPNDSDQDPRSTAFEQFGPSKIGANVVWNDVSESSSVVVCVLDSGVAYDHEDLVNQMWINDDEIPDNGIDDDANGYIDDIYGWDMQDNDKDIKETNGDYYYHGTSCSGVVAAERDNGLGCTGIAPNCKIMGIRIGFGYTYLSAILNGVMYARRNGADIISMSFSSTEYSSIMYNSMKYAWNDGLVLVAAAANDDNQDLHYPAAYDSVVCVGGTTPFGPAWNWQPIDEVRITGAGGYGWGSNYGPQLEVMAFGEFYITLKGDNIHSYYTGSNNDFFRGTSNATPMVAGAFALLKSMYPDSDNQWLRDRIRDTADDLDVPGFDIQTGYGRVNLVRACYGADRYADSEDENGFVDVAVDDYQMIDSIHAVTGNYADTEDLYKITATQDGYLNFFLDIWTWGESLDLFLYSDPSLAPQFLIDQSVGKNHAINSFEVAGCACTEGETYYVMVTPDGYGDSTTYTLSVEYVQPFLDLETATYDIGFVHLGGNNKLLGRLDFSSSLITRISEIMFNIKGTMPGSKLTKLSLFKDTYKNGTFDGLDQFVADAQLFGTNRVIFKNLYEEISRSTSPTRYFLRANFSGITEDAEFVLEMSNY
ncbi:MAG: S8 family serine peptidase, partial [bacterium]|nr:S8 family serine peptidase [bacterium]